MCIVRHIYTSTPTYPLRERERKEGKNKKRNQMLVINTETELSFKTQSWSIKLIFLAYRIKTGFQPRGNTLH